LRNAIGRMSFGRRLTLPPVVAGHRWASSSNTLSNKRPRFNRPYIPALKDRGFTARLVKNQSAPVAGVDDDRRRPKRPARATRLRLAVVDVVGLVEGLFRWSQRQNHGGRAGRIQALLKSSDTALRIEVRCKRPGIADQRLVLSIRLSEKRIPVQPYGVALE